MDYFLFEAKRGYFDYHASAMVVMLRSIDIHWIEHLTVMENTRQGIGLQGVAQLDPLVAYKRQGV